MRQYKLAYGHYELIRAEIKILLENNIIFESCSEYRSPLLVVEKKNNPGAKPWICCDLREVNAVVIPFDFELSRIDEIFHKLSRARVFCKLDVKKGYYNMLIYGPHREKYSFSFENTIFSFVHVPFGSRNAAQMFSHIMKLVLEEMDPNHYILYIDDILIYGETQEVVQVQLELCLKVLQTQNIKLHSEKCEFMIKKLKFLGYCLFEGNLSPDQRKVEILRRFKRPINVKQIKTFLGKILYNKM
jgi:hypothetical protein